MLHFATVLGQNVTFECDYQMRTENVTFCFIQTNPQVTSQDSTLIRVTGNRLDGYDHSNIEVFFIRDRQMKFFPRNFSTFFASIMQLYVINCSLSAIKPKDLQGLENRLIYVNLSGNQLRSIEAHTFHNLRHLDLHDNKIELVHPEWMKTSAHLYYLDFSGNKCINEQARQTNFEIITLISMIVEKCQVSKEELESENTVSKEEVTRDTNDSERMTRNVEDNDINLHGDRQREGKILNLGKDNLNKAILNINQTLNELKTTINKKLNDLNIKELAESSKTQEMKLDSLIESVNRLNTSLTENINTLMSVKLSNQLTEFQANLTQNIDQLDSTKRSQNSSNMELTDQPIDSDEPEASTALILTNIALITIIVVFMLFKLIKFFRMRTKSSPESHYELPKINSPPNEPDVVTLSNENYEDPSRYYNNPPVEYSNERVYEELPNGDLSGVIDYAMSFKSTSRAKSSFDASYEELNCDKEATGYEEVGFSKQKGEERNVNAENLPSKLLCLIKNSSF